MSSGVPDGNAFGLSDYDMPRPLDPDADLGASEFSWGDGLEPQSVRGKPPSEGGMYKGLSPDCAPQVGVSRR
jgi:hypothetical protein